jgi:hypothetical protein
VIAGRVATRGAGVGRARASSRSVTTRATASVTTRTSPSTARAARPERSRRPKERLP